jgi:hypothetical protein
MSQDEMLDSGGSPPILPQNNLLVRTANTDSHGFHEDCAVACIGLRHILQPRSPFCSRLYGYRFNSISVRKIMFNLSGLSGLECEDVELPRRKIEIEALRNQIRSLPAVGCVA